MLQQPNSPTAPSRSSASPAPYSISGAHPAERLVSPVPEQPAGQQVTAAMRWLAADEVWNRDWSGVA